MGDVHSDDAGREKQASAAPASSGDASKAPLTSFPREFNKRHFLAMDWRFLTILVLSVFVHYYAIRYMVEHRPEETLPPYVITLQNEFSNRFLDNALPGGGKTVSENDILASDARWAQEIVQATPPVDLGGEVDPAAEVRDGPDGRPATTYERREKIRETVTAVRDRDQADVRRKVKEIGLLGVIASGSGLVGTDEVEDILAYADSSTPDLGRQIAAVSALRVPRPGSESQLYLETRRSRAARMSGPGLNGLDMAGQLAAVELPVVPRNTTFEEVKVVPVANLGMRVRRDVRYTHRTAEQIREVVVSHNPAIQDCYRLALKYMPDLKGKVTVRITVRPSGHVDEVEILDSTMISESFGDCLIERISRWNDFGEVPETEGNLAFRHTYVFGD